MPENQVAMGFRMNVLVLAQLFVRPAFDARPRAKKRIAQKTFKRSLK